MAAKPINTRIGAAAPEPLRAYLAGPDVFLRNAVRIAADRKRLCAKYGVIALCPEDSDPTACKGSPVLHARAIAAANEALIRQCDFVIANCSPFRGVSLDAGTAYEIGYACALGKPVFGYSNVLASYKRRVAHYRRLGDPLAADVPRSRVEDFGLADNLMVATALASDLVRGRVQRGREIAAQEAFARCLALATRTMRAGRQAAAPVRKAQQRA